MAVSFFNADLAFRLPHKTALNRFIQHRFETQTGKKISANVVFCSDDFLLKINEQYLKHYDYTDIITFPLSAEKSSIKAELYISIERVRENAAERKIDFPEELQRVLFHGFLHLAGYGDKTAAEKKTMREMEEEWMTAYGRYRENDQE